ncbi:DinB family protein [uncultured Gimesia sp.]|uniref:DinB family protein n=1 Tax=uncultured Gimesia sp. TaxID=1678688 RepID=UPI002624EBED|nr:DinB family protein [uncultured Gimesia sp.]
MSIAAHIKDELQLPTFVVQGYIQDLTDEDLMRRPVENANHIAWQLGHLIVAEHDLNNMVCPDSMPDLPEGFTEKHGKETASSDDQAAFCTKDEYLAYMAEQRAGTLALLDTLSDEDLQKPSPEKLQQFGATVGAVIAGQSAHWMMHAGQWVIVRRQLGKEAMF